MLNSGRKTGNFTLIIGFLFPKQTFDDCVVPCDVSRDSLSYNGVSVKSGFPEFAMQFTESFYKLLYYFLSDNARKLTKKYGHVVITIVSSHGLYMLSGSVDFGLQAKHTSIMRRCFNLQSKMDRAYSLIISNTKIVRIYQ